MRQITEVLGPGTETQPSWVVQSERRSCRVLGLAELVALLLEVLKVGDDVASLD